MSKSSYIQSRQNQKDTICLRDWSFQKPTKTLQKPTHVKQPSSLCCGELHLATTCSNFSVNNSATLCTPKLDREALCDFAARYNTFSSSTRQELNVKRLQRYTSPSHLHHLEFPWTYLREYHLVRDLQFVECAESRPTLRKRANRLLSKGIRGGLHGAWPLRAV